MPTSARAAQPPGAASSTFRSLGCGARGLLARRCGSEGRQQRRVVPVLRRHLDEPHLGVPGDFFEEGRRRRLQYAQNRDDAVQRRQHRLAKDGGPGLMGPQLVHQQDVPPGALGQGRRAQAVKAGRGLAVRRAADEEQICGPGASPRPGRSRCTDQASPRYARVRRVQNPPTLPGKSARGGAQQCGLAHLLGAGQKDVPRHGAPPLGPTGALPPAGRWCGDAVAVQHRDDVHFDAVYCLEILRRDDLVGGAEPGHLALL